MGQMPRIVATALALSTATGPALAQTDDTRAPRAPAAAVADVAPAHSDSEPTMPDVSDPMLTPVPPPARTLTTWRDALVLVRQRSTALHISQANIEQAMGASRSALAAALPQLNAQALLNRHLLLGTGLNQTSQGFVTNTTIPDPATSLTGSLGLSVPVINFAAWSGVRVAKEAERSKELSAKDTERQLLAAAAQAAVAAITADRVADSSRGSLRSALSTLDLTKRRAALGAASAVDVVRADQDVSLSRAQVVAANESLRQAREALGAALGDTVQWGVSDQIHMEELEQTASAVCKPVESLDTRADIQAAAKAVDVATRDRSTVDSSFAPTLDLVSSVGYVDYALRSPNGEHFTWTIGGQLKWLLYDGGARYGLERQKDAATTLARETLTQTKRDATVKLTQADRGVLVAQENLDVSTHARDLARDFARLSRIAFVNGSGTSFDLVDSSRRLREAEIDLLVKEFGVLQARLAAYLGRANCSI